MAGGAYGPGLGAVGSIGGAGMAEPGGTKPLYGGVGGAPGLEFGGITRPGIGAGIGAEGVGGE